MRRSTLSHDRGRAPLLQQLVAGLELYQIRARDRLLTSLVVAYLVAEVTVLPGPSPYQTHAGHMVAADTGQWSLGSAAELWRFGHVQQG